MAKRPTFKARDLGELINALPVLYGFPPQNSLVALGLTGSRITFGMRLDLPVPSAIDELADLAVRHLEHQQIEGAIILAIGEPLDVGQRAVSAVEARLVRVRPIAGGWANDERYWVSMDGGDPDGYPYRRTLDHPATAQAVWAGQEVSVSREAVAVRVLPEGGQRRHWVERSADAVTERLAADVAQVPHGDVGAWAEEEFLPVIHDLLAGRPVDDGTVLRLGFALTAVEIRDLIWGLITVENARDMVRVWLHVSRLIPVSWTPAALCLAAFAAWRSGDGALTVIATERALEVEPDYPMAGLMLALATSGISPFAWEGMADSPESWPGDDRAAS
jgi:hypothetical protein